MQVGGAVSRCRSRLVGAGTVGRCRGGSCVVRAVSFYVGSSTKFYVETMPIEVGR